MIPDRRVHDGPIRVFSFAGIPPVAVETGLGDNLSDTTRKEQRALLGMSVMALFIAWTGLVARSVRSHLRFGRWIFH